MLRKPARASSPCCSVSRCTIGLASSTRCWRGCAAFQSDTGRPHWLVLDEAHHLLSEHVERRRSLPPALDSTMLITCASRAVAARGARRRKRRRDRRGHGRRRLRQFAAALAPSRRKSPLAEGDALALGPQDTRRRWRSGPRAARRTASATCASTAEGTLGPDKSFFFRGRNGSFACARRTSACSCRWRRRGQHGLHLHRGDYSTWVVSIKTTICGEIAIEARISARQPVGRGEASAALYGAG